MGIRLSGSAPVMRWRLAPSVFLSSFSFLKVAKALTSSVMPQASSFFRNLASLTSHLEPKLDVRSVSVSFVCARARQSSGTQHSTGWPRCMSMQVRQNVLQLGTSNVASLILSCIT